MIEVTMGQVVRDYRVALQRTLDHLSMDSVQSIAREILSAYDRDGRIYLCGNGGSAATASHMACDLAKNTAVADLPRLRVHALTDNTALISALANDIGYAAIFSEQLLLAPVTASDLVIAISGRGASPNVLNGVATAVAAGARTIGITGFGGGQLAPAVDVALIVPSDSMEIVEDAHLMVNHAVTSAIRSALQARAAVVA